MEIEDIINELSKYGEIKRGNFTAKVVPNSGEVLGLKSKEIKQYVKDNNSNLKELIILEPNKVYEIDIIRALSIAKIDVLVKEKIKLIDEFSYTIKNWAICDTFCCSYKIKKNDRNVIFKYAIALLNDNFEFRIRLGIVLLLAQFLSIEYIDEIFLNLSKIKTGDYYVDMAYAWLLSVMYIKFNELTKKYLTETKISNFVLRKTVSKIQDSFRVSIEDKKIAKTFLLKM